MNLYQIQEQLKERMTYEILTSQIPTCVINVEARNLTANQFLGLINEVVEAPNIQVEGSMYEIYPKHGLYLANKDFNTIPKDNRRACKTSIEDIDSAINIIRSYDLRNNMYYKPMKLEIVESDGNSVLTALDVNLITYLYKKMYTMTVVKKDGISSLLVQFNNKFEKCILEYRLKDDNRGTWTSAEGNCLGVALHWDKTASAVKINSNKNLVTDTDMLHTVREVMERFEVEESTATHLINLVVTRF